jgi:hypothetical protein
MRHVRYVRQVYRVSGDPWRATSGCHRCRVLRAAFRTVELCRNKACSQRTVVKPPRHLSVGEMFSHEAQSGGDDRGVVPLPECQVRLWLRC